MLKKVLFELVNAALVLRVLLHIVPRDESVRDVLVWVRVFENEQNLVVF